jgi:hypothetical protein
MGLNNITKPYPGSAQARQKTNNQNLDNVSHNFAVAIQDVIPGTKVLAGFNYKTFFEGISCSPVPYMLIFYLALYGNPIRTC